MKPLVLAAALSLAAAPALAETDLTRSTSGHTYFNRPGASAETHDAELRQCLKAARLTSQPDTAAAGAPGGGLLGALVVGIVKGVMEGMAERRGVAANIENCMVVRGWRVVRLNDADGEALATLEPPALAQQLATHFGAEPPRGAVARAFDNDIGKGAARTNLPSGDLDKLSLSLKALPKALEEPQTERAKLPRMQRSARAPSALKPEQIKFTPGSALIAVRLTGSGEQGGAGLMFVRQGPDADTPAWVDGGAGHFDARLPARFFKRDSERLDRTLVFAVPPGRWRIAAVNADLFGTAFCLGSPAFDVAAGEAVFAGSFALDRALTPDLTAIPPGADLGQAGKALRPAVYINGVEANCGGAYIYALEVPGAPFAPGYALGSAATAPLPAPPIANAPASLVPPATPPADPAAPVSGTQLVP